MNKTIVITVVVDNVPLSHLEDIQGTLEKQFETYPDKRINISIQDEPLVTPRLR